MARSPLNRTTAPVVIRLFDYCFKQGVLDACAVEDDYLVKEWLDRRKQDGSYGLLSDMDTEYDWKRWRFTLFRWCRIAKMTTLGENYIDMIRKHSNFLFCVLPISMSFYLMGVEEWLEYPNPTNTALFKQKNKIHWKPVPDHLKNITKDDFISYTQEFTYERQKLHAMAAENEDEETFKKDASDNAYNEFCTALWALTRPCDYAVRKYKADAEEL